MEGVVNGYEDVIDSYINSIFQSGMLLNEHDELLSQFWKPIISKKSKFTRMYLMSSSLLTGFVINVYRKSAIVAVILTFPLGIELYMTIQQKYKCRSYKKQFSSFMDILQAIFTLTKKIIQHYQLRKVTIKNLSGSTKVLIEDLISIRMLHFLSDVGELIFGLVLYLKNALKRIGDIIDIGDLNFVFGIDLNEENFKTSKDASEESVLNNYDKIQMAYIYVTSSFLCGLGLSFCINEWKSKNIEFAKLFSSIIPECLEYSNYICEKIKGDFAAISNTLQNNAIEKVAKNNDKPMLNTLNNLKEYIQISFNIASLLEYQLMSCTENAIIKNNIEDLETLFSQCTDTLKVLQYTVYKVQSMEVESFTPMKEEKRDEPEIMTIIHNEPHEKIEDEEFNLSVHGSDSDESETSNLEYEQLLEYVKAQKLMIRELNDELRKRNIIKQNDFMPIRAKRTHTNQDVSISSEPPPASTLLVDAISNTSNSKSTLETSDRNVLTVNDFLTQIRAAATNRGVEETVFGDDIISSDESSEEN